MGDLSRLRPVGFIILAVLVYHVGVAEVVSRIRAADIGLFATGFACLLVSSIVFLVRWQVLLAGIGRRLAWRSAYEIVLLGLFSNLVTPGRLGDIPVRAFFLKRREGVPVKDGLSTTSGDRYIDIMFLMLVGLVSLGLLAEVGGLQALAGPEVARMRSTVYTILFAMALVPVVVVARTHQVVTLLRRVLPERVAPQLDALDEALPQVLANMRTFLAGRSLAAIIVTTPLMWLLYALTFHYYLLSLGQAADPMVVLPAFFVAYLFGLVSMVPGGIGTSDLGVVAILAQTGIDSSAALVASMAVKVTNLLYVGVLCLFIPDRADIGEAAGLAEDISDTDEKEDE